MTTKKEKLPSRRTGYTQTFAIGGQTLHLRTGEYEDGRLGEIFVTLQKDGSLVRFLVNCFCIAISIGLQHGVPLSDFVEKFSNVKCDPSGYVNRHQRIKFADSIIDLIFRDLAIHYLGREELANRKNEEPKC